MRAGALRVFRHKIISQRSASLWISSRQRAAEGTTKESLFRERAAYTREAGRTLLRGCDALRPVPATCGRFSIDREREFIRHQEGPGEEEEEWRRVGKVSPVHRGRSGSIMTAKRARRGFVVESRASSGRRVRERRKGQGRVRAEAERERERATCYTVGLLGLFPAG